MVDPCPQFLCVANTSLILLNRFYHLGILTVTVPSWLTLMFHFLAVCDLFEPELPEFKPSFFITFFTPFPKELGKCSPFLNVLMMPPERTEALW